MPAASPDRLHELFAQLGNPDPASNWILAAWWLMLDSYPACSLPPCIWTTRLPLNDDPLGVLQSDSLSTAYANAFNAVMHSNPGRSLRLATADSLVAALRSALALELLREG
jgi:hypothetical protein